jgi:RNA polymerase primary sigma factor
MKMLGLTIQELHDQIQSQKRTCEDLVLFYLKNIKKDNKEFNVFLDITEEYALEKAKKVDEKVKNGEEIGLLEGIKRFDVSKDYRLSTYATWWIKKELIKSLKTKINSVKIPNYIFMTYRKIKLADSKISDEKENRATNEEIASYLKMDIKEVLNIKKIINSKLITINGDNVDNNFAMELEDNNTEEEINENIEKMNRNSKINKMFRSLNEREKQIIGNYFGLHNGEKQTYKEIGEGLNLSAERVRVLKDRALRKLRYAGSKMKND